MSGDSKVAHTDLQRSPQLMIESPVSVYILPSRTLSSPPGISLKETHVRYLQILPVHKDENWIPSRLLERQERHIHPLLHIVSQVSTPILPSLTPFGVLSGYLAQGASCSSTKDSNCYLNRGSIDLPFFGFFEFFE